MPIYGFKCQICNGQSEVMRRFDEPDFSIAPMCCGIPMQRDFTAPAIHFKGTGWGGSK